MVDENPARIKWSVAVSIARPITNVTWVDQYFDFFSIRFSFNQNKEKKTNKLACRRAINYTNDMIYMQFYDISVILSIGGDSFLIVSRNS